MKLDQALGRCIPPGPLKEAARSAYYRFYYNGKHRAANGFDVTYAAGAYRYHFPNGITFRSRENFADELTRSLGGYLAHYTLRPGDTVIDAGAYVGEFTLYAAVAVGPAGRVIAFEPDGANRARLEANIALNGCTNITVIGKGVWSGDTTLAFIGDPVKGYSFLTASAADETKTELPVVSIDAELARLGIGSVAFIKMDVEGSEVAALAGAVETLEKGHPAVAVASYHQVNGEKTCSAVEWYLADRGYRVESAHPQHLTTYGWYVPGKGR